MKHWVLAVLAIALGGQAPGYQAEIEKARAVRIAELKADDGWLTVAGLYWLKPGKNVAGSAPSTTFRASNPPYEAPTTTSL